MEARRWPAESRHRLPRVIAWLMLTLWLALASAQDVLPVPPLQARVTDQTGTLSPEQSASLEAKLRDFEARKGVQIAALIVRSTSPEPVEQYALRVAEQWKLGRKKVDDGALLLVAKDDRTVRIEVGYGIEGSLSDVVANRIINETIVPRFRQGDFGGGVAAGLEQMMRVVDGEPLPAPSRLPTESGELRQAWPLLFFVALVLSGIVRQLLGRLTGALVVGGVLGAVSWFVAGTLAVAAAAGLTGFFVTLLGLGLGRHGGYYGGGGGGSGGGGFSGGGGGFGGGGASGRW